MKKVVNYIIYCQRVRALDISLSNESKLSSFMNNLKVSQDRPWNLKKNNFISVHDNVHKKNYRYLQYTVVHHHLPLLKFSTPRHP